MGCDAANASASACSSEIPTRRSFNDNEWCNSTKIANNRDFVHRVVESAAANGVFITG